jgi:aarF domain-containing kinase
VGDLRESMLDELDFTREAQSLIEFRAFLARNNIIDATAPLPYIEASSKRVLTMEYLKGILNNNVLIFFHFIHKLIQ